MEPFSVARNSPNCHGLRMKTCTECNQTVTVNEIEGVTQSNGVRQPTYRELKCTPSCVNDSKPVDD